MALATNPINIPPEIAATIVQYAAADDLCVLARTSRALQHEAEVRIYKHIELFHGRRVFQACLKLIKHRRLAPHVRRFVVISPHGSDFDNGNVISYNHQQTAQWDNREYWEAMRHAIAGFRDLEYLHIADPLMSHSWVLTPPEGYAGNDQRTPTIRRRVYDCRLYVACDEDMLTFLEESDIQNLTIGDISDDEPPRPLDPDSLQNLTLFDGPLIMALQLVHTPLTHLKIILDTVELMSSPVLPMALRELRAFSQLRSLALMNLPEKAVVASMDAISTACPNLVYLSLIPLPVEYKLVSVPFHSGRFASPTIKIDSLPFLLL